MFFISVLSNFNLIAFFSQSPARSLKCLLCISSGMLSCTLCLLISQTARTLLIASCFSLVEGTWSCEECSTSRVAYCTHQQPAPAWQFQAEQMHAPSLSSTQYESKSILFFYSLFNLFVISRSLISSSQPGLCLELHIYCS